MEAAPPPELPSHSTPHTSLANHHHLQLHTRCSLHHHQHTPLKPSHYTCSFCFASDLLHICQTLPDSKCLNAIAKSNRLTAVKANMGEAAAGVAYGLKNLVEGAAILAKGIYDPTLPLKAKLSPVEDVDLPRAHHTAAVIKGRVYIFGGKTDKQQLADNDMHVVMLPMSSMESTDYKRVEAGSETPPRRYGHACAVIEERLYIFGGCGENGEPLDEQGRVWVYDTNRHAWSHLDAPPSGPRPGPRCRCLAVATDHPRPAASKPDGGILPQQPPDPEVTLPDLPATDTYGTLIIQAGQGRCGKSDDSLNDLWSFDISTRTWAELPEPPFQTGARPSLSIVRRRLYMFAQGQMSYLDLSHSPFDDQGGKGELELSPLGPWSSMAHSADRPDAVHPGPRSGASMIPVTTGQGRHYLMLVGGETPTGEALQDVWSLQLPPEGMTAASFKDATRMTMKKETHEAQWDEVKYLDSEGVLIQEGQSGRGVGARQGFAAAKGADIDGASLLLWGGIGADGVTRGDGLVVTVE